MDLKEAKIIYNSCDSVAGFINLFWEFVPEYQSQELAYEAAERKYRTACRIVTGEEKNKYANFESFRVSRDKYLKKK